MDEPLITIDEARARVLEVAGGRVGEEVVSVDEALDRILATDLRASQDSPPFDCSAMDGYALGPGATPGVFGLAGESRAGTPYVGSSLREGDAIRISTGAAIPGGTRSVARQEDTACTPRIDEIAVLTEVTQGANIRASGEDMRSGELVLGAGTWIGPGEIGAAVAAGARALNVARRPIVTVVCTGDELRAPGAQLGPGEIHNSNDPMLRAFARRAGAAPGPGGGRVSDDPDTTARTLDAALDLCDVLVISGGVSVGPHDHVRPVLERLAVTPHFWGVALQPGRPTWFGSRGGKLVFALPGNPVSVAVTFTLFVRPAIEALLGARPERTILQTARLATDVRRNGKREQAIRVMLETHEDQLLATPTGPQASHMLTSLARADALALIPRGAGMLPAGTIVSLELLPR